MRRARLARDAARSLVRHPLRTALMTLATLVGVAALTGVVAYGRGTRRAVLDNFDRMFGGSTIILMAGGGAARAGPHETGLTATLTLDDLAAVAEAVPAVEAWDPLQMLGAFDVVAGETTRPIDIMGHSEAHEVVWNRGVSAGSYFGADDVARSARVAVVGERLVEELFGGIDPVGATIRIGGVPFEVIGVLDPVGIDPHGIDKDREIHVPITTAMRRLANRDWITTAKLAVRESADLDAVMRRVEDVLRPRHALGPREPDDFRMITPVQVEDAIASGDRLFTVLLPVIAGIALLVGGIVVANLMLVSVSGRRAEIGLRKAVGARDRDIGAHFLFESVAVTLLGGVLALGVARLALALLGGASTVARGAASGPGARVPLTLPWEVALLGVGAAVLVGVVAGVGPARRAAATEPTDALR